MGSGKFHAGKHTCCCHFQLKPQFCLGTSPETRISRVLNHFYQSLPGGAERLHVCCSILATAPWSLLVEVLAKMRSRVRRRIQAGIF